MAVVQWGRERAVGLVDPLALDELDGHVLVLEGVSAADDQHLGWCRRAPCVVIGSVAAEGSPPASVDVVVSGPDAPLLERLVASTLARPQACRVLVEVLRAMPSLDVASGLSLESLAYSNLLTGQEFATWLGSQPKAQLREFEAPPVRVEREDNLLRVTLSRPDRRNALSAAMRDALFEALTMLEIDPTIDHVVLSGDGPVFSSGGDLAEFGIAGDVVRAHEIRIQRSVGAILARGASKVIALVHGPCAGAGVELSAFAGRVRADPGASFRLPEISMGLIPGAGGTVSVTRRIGRQQTARFAILGDPISANEALALGLVDEVG